MVLTCPSMATVRGLRRVLGGFVDDLLHVGGDRAEIAALRGAVDLDHRLDVVLRIDRRHVSTRLMSAMAPSVCDGAPGAVIGRFCSAFSESI